MAAVGKGRKGRKDRKSRKGTKQADAAGPDEKRQGRKADEASPDKPVRLKNKVYEKELEKLHVELVKLQEWVKFKGLKVCIVFEGRDGAGKGGAIKAITERVSPRVFRVVALAAPTEREKSRVRPALFAAPAGGR